MIFVLLHCVVVAQKLENAHMHAHFHTLAHHFNTNFKRVNSTKVEEIETGEINCSDVHVFSYTTFDCIIFFPRFEINMHVT